MSSFLFFSTSSDSSEQTLNGVEEKVSERTQPRNDASADFR